MTLRNQISAAAGIPQKRPEAIFRQPVARWITVATQFQSDLALLRDLLLDSLLRRTGHRYRVRLAVGYDYGLGKRA